MASRSYSFYGYSADAFEIDPATGNAVLKSDYSASDRARFEVTDDDTFADGDANNDEVGDDSNQEATVYASDGSVIGDGQVYIEEVRWYESSDGDMISVTVFEIDGEVVGYVPSEPFEPGESYEYQGSSEAGEKVGKGNNNASRNNYNSYEDASVACFGPGTMITTDEGDMPVEWLETSDRVLTRDEGFQPILWIGRTKLPAAYFRQYPDEAPVCIPAGALGCDTPTHDLHLTGDHRVMIHSSLAEMYFASSEVLAPAKTWLDVGLAKPVRPTKSYTVTHILCASHQIIVAQGAWVESMFTGVEALRRLSADDRAHIDTLLNGRMTKTHTARRCLTRKEARMLLSQSQMALPMPLKNSA